MSTIRPHLPPVALPQAPSQAQTQTQAQRPVDPARLAAQKAFFAAALGQAQAPAAASASGAPQAAARPVAATGAAAPSEPTQRILRPGSIIDIRV